MSDVSPVSVSQTEALNSSEGMTTRVARGGLWILSAQAVGLITSFLATPFIIRLLGTESFGVLSLINVVISYLTFSEFGMGVASTRFGSEAHAHNDQEKESAVVWTSLVIAAVPTLLVSVIFAFGARYTVEHALRLPVGLY